MRELLDFSLTAAAEHEAGRQTEMGKVGPVNAAVSQAREVKAKVGNSQWAGGKPSGDAQGWVSLRWWVVGRPWLSSRTGWPWPALGVYLRQFLAFSSEFSEEICSPAPSSQRPSLLNREGLGWRDYKAESSLFL